ncbi:MAG TPA: PilX N-terminal domain-containing pilus assembly protein [Micromonosporaceae bacterium]
MIQSRQQRGATLMVTLIMLVVLTLFAVTAFNLSGVNLKIVGNYQQQKSIESVVQQAIEQIMSTITIFTTPAETDVCVNGTGGGCTGGYLVKVYKPKCNYTTTAKGYTKKIGELTPEDTNWEVRASFTDAFSKASVAIVQGVAVRMLAGNCPSS